MTSNSLKGPGAYYVCGVSINELYDTSDAKYFVKHPNLKWIPTHTTKALEVPGTISVKNYDSVSLVARFHLTKNGENFTEIGFLWTEHKNLYFSHPETRIGNETRDANFDVLVCQP